MSDSSHKSINTDLRHSLRFRIVAAFVLSGLLLGLFFALVVYGYLHNMEDKVIINVLNLEANSFAENWRKDNTAKPPYTLLLKGYLVDTRRENPFADWQADHRFARLRKPGDYELEKEHQLVVKPLDENVMLYLFHNNAEVDPLDNSSLHEMLVIAVTLMVLLSGWFGFIIAKRMIAPVVKLADQVAEAQPQHLPIALIGPFYQDEVGELAGALQAAMNRITQFIEREQRFTRDASHELRTPVTVIKGALELMEKQITAGKPTQQIPRRIKRAVLDMENIIETFLYLGREGDATAIEGHCLVETVVQNQIESNRYLLEEKPVTPRIQLDGEVRANAPESVVSIAVGNLIRNAFQYTDQGEILIQVGNGRVTVQDHGPGINRHQLTLIQERDYRGGTGEGFGLGLAIVRDFCERRGWTLTIASEPGKGTEVSLCFGN